MKGGGNEARPLAEQELTVQKWSILWRTIVLSCTGETLHPYCRYLRVLDMRDLYDLLDDDKFRGKIQKSALFNWVDYVCELIVFRNFYAGSMSRFNTSAPVKRIAQKAANLRAVISAIGEGVFTRGL